MKIAFLFAGQGAQYVGMGKELYQTYEEARNVFDSVHTDFTIDNLCFEGPKAMLDDTAYAQTSIFVTSMAIAKVIESKGIVPEYVAGLSLGEYSALCYANSFSLEDGVQITRERGKLMANALPKWTTGMSAVLQLDADSILEVCKEVKHLGVCEIANYNCPGQIVITGDIAALDEAKPRLLEKGARKVIPLQVSGAFHSSKLIPASKQLRKVLDTFTLRKPNIPTVFNVCGTVSDEDVASLLEKQICNSVRFMESVEYMIKQGIDTFIEIGPGKVLSGFVRKINRDVRTFAVEDIASLEAMLGEIA